jgi:hypothetical protein
MQRKGLYYELVIAQNEKEKELVEKTNESTKNKIQSRLLRMTKMLFNN